MGFPAGHSTKRDMRIGITCYPVYGGSGVVATELGVALAARGHQIHFIAYSLPFRLREISGNVFFHEVDVSRYPLFDFPPYALSLTSKMVDVARYESLDVLHVHYAIPHATSAVIAREILAQQGLTVPVVTTLHGTDITMVGRDPSFAPVVAYSINASDGVTAVSRFLRNETYESFSVNNEIEVIPNFIDGEQFRRQEKGHFKRALCPNQEKVIVHVSNFRRVKNVPDVIRIFHRLREDGHAVKLLLVGDGPDRSNAEHLVRELGVKEDVRFLGKQDPVAEILSIADLFVLPSGSESFGLAPLEAMACSVPVVCSDTGGLPELVEGSGAGLLCPLGDVDAFARACARLLSDDALRLQMAEAARSHALKHFDMAAIIPRYEAYYERVVGSSRR